MKAQVWTVLVCECGSAMINCERPDRDSVMCVNRECPNLYKKFAIPAVELSEAPSEREALMTRT